MSPRKSDSRDRMLRSTMTFLREYGANATSIERVLAHSGAPRGSVYHYFPGGRTQLAHPPA
jgi:AcrR family transcriptional regulator